MMVSLKYNKMGLKFKYINGLKFAYKNEIKKLNVIF